MPFSFSFSPANIAGIANPFAAPHPAPPPPVPPTAHDAHPNRRLRPLPAHSHAVNTHLAPPHHQHNHNPIPGPPPRRRAEQHFSSASTSTLSLALEPAASGNGRGLKRGWVPAHAEPSRAATLQTHTEGYLDTPAKYRDMMMGEEQDEATEEMAADLPPAKRRRGVTGSIISTAFSAALIGTAVGLTVYRLWRDRGKEPEQGQIAPPPPYQQGNWVDGHQHDDGQHPAHGELDRDQDMAGPSILAPPTTPVHARTSRRPRPSPATIGRRAGAGISARHRKAGSSSVRHAQRSLSPSVDPRFDFSNRKEEEVDVDDQMDWMGDKLAQLIEDGKRALGAEVVVASETAEDEVDDGHGEWEELDYENPRTGPPSSASASASFGSARRRGGSRARPSPLFPASSSSASHPNSARGSPRSATFQISEFGQVHPRSVAWDVSASASAGSASRQLPPSVSGSFRDDDTALAGMSPALRDSMENARAAYLARRAVNGSQASHSQGFGV